MNRKLFGLVINAIYDAKKYAIHTYMYIYYIYSYSSSKGRILNDKRFYARNQLKKSKWAEQEREIEIEGSE